MKRLIDEDHRPDSPDYQLAVLVRATPRLESAPFQRQRILSRVTSAANGEKKRHRAAIPIAVAILAGATLAAAAVGRFRVASPTPSAPAATLPEAPVAGPLVPVATAEVTSVPPPAVDLPATPPVSAAPLDRPSARLRTTAPLKDGEDPAAVLEAIRALRNNGDPARAGALLAQYLKAHPRGVLSEDASALSIEAAVARHDTRSAADLARRYLSQFPNGRYRGFAVQTAQAAPAP
jgi:hypothetical protein